MLKLYLLLILVGAKQQNSGNESEEDQVANAECSGVGLRSFVDPPRSHEHRYLPRKRYDGKARAGENDRIPYESNKAKCLIGLGHRIESSRVI